MKSNRKTKFIILIILGILFALSPIFLNNPTSTARDRNITSNYNDKFDKENLKISKVSGKIHIDNNWTDAEAVGICTGNGTYSDPYVIEDLVIDGGGSGRFPNYTSCILIENSDVYFKIVNCTLFNSDEGISMINTNSGQILNNTCSNNNIRGMLLRNCNNSIISGNTVNNNIVYGISLYGSNNNTISGNTVNNTYIGILLYGWWFTISGFNNVVSGNLMNECGLRVGGNLEILLSHEIDTTNLVNGKPLYYYVNEVGLGPDNFTNVGQVILVNCNDSLVSNLNISDSSIGISLHYCNNSIISGNTVNNNNYYGIFLYHSNNNIVSGNTANNNSNNGINLQFSNNNTISGNTVNNSNIGIRFYRSNNSIVSGNTANTNNYFGIFFENSKNNIVSGNTVNNNNIYGIFLWDSNYNTISENFINYNTEIGIYLRYSDGNTLSSNNVSYNNYHGICLSKSDSNTLSGNTVKDNALNGLHLSQCRNNIIEGNFIINNDVGIYLINNLHYYNLFEVESANNEISNNIYTGNNQDIQEVTNIIEHPFRSLWSIMVILLSIITVGIVITSLTVELIRKRSYHREDEKYHPPIYGISALVVESAGALLFILGAIFLIPVDSLLFWLLILIPFAVVGILISRKGRKNDAKKSLARLGIGFGILLIILNSPLILTGVVVAVVIIVIAPVVIGIYVWNFLNQKKKNKRIPR